MKSNLTKNNKIEKRVFNSLSKFNKQKENRHLISIIKSLEKE